MTPWINIQTALKGTTVKLMPLAKEHLPTLQALAKDRRIWEHYPFDLSDSLKFQQIFTTALVEKDKGNQFPFTVLLRQSDTIIGSTRFLDIQPQHKKLEIGFTWLHPHYWGTVVNLECKLLLLTYCFENLQALRVQLKTDSLNLRSRKAIEKIGGQFEGILRNDILRDNGTHRHSAYFSIIDGEWKRCKSNLIELVTNSEIDTD